MPKLIEIIGSPGSGKTFISSELQMLKKNSEQIYFHSSNWRNFDKFKDLNIFSKVVIKFKVAVNIVFFYLIFYKRLLLKKIYKRGFFFRIVFLAYRHLVSIELLKKSLSDKEYLVMEPGIIMYFLQDYFYSDKKITKKEINIFNKLFVKTDYIICTNCDFNTSIQRLKSRDRGLPQRMRNLSMDEINYTIKKSNEIINEYVSKNNLNSKILKIDTSNSVEEIRSKLLTFFS